MSSKRALAQIDDGDEIPPQQTLRRSTRQRQNATTRSNAADLSMNDGSQELISLHPTRASTTTTTGRGRKSYDPLAPTNNNPQQLVEPLMPLTVIKNSSIQRSASQENGNNTSNGSFGRRVSPVANNTSTTSKKNSSKSSLSPSSVPKYHPIHTTASSIKFTMTATPPGEFGSVKELFEALGPYELTDSNITSFTQNGKEQQCSSCLEPYRVGDKVIIAPCLHRFHFECIVDWFEHNHDKKLQIIFGGANQLIQSYLQQIDLFNEQFQPRHEYIYSPITKQHVMVVREPSNEEISRFSAPPQEPLLRHPARVECDIHCPWCSCDWKQLLMGPGAAGDEEDIDFSQFQ